MTLFLRLTAIGLLLGCVSNPVLASDGVVDTDDALVKSPIISQDLVSQENNPDLPLASTEDKVASTPSSVPDAVDAIPVEENKNDGAAKKNDSVISVQPDAGKGKKTKGCGGCTLF